MRLVWGQSFLSQPYTLHIYILYNYIGILSYGDLTPFLGSVWHPNWKVHGTFNVTHLKLVILRTLLVVFTTSQVVTILQQCSMGQNAPVKNSANHHNLLANFNRHLFDRQVTLPHHVWKLLAPPTPVPPRATAIWSIRPWRLLPLQRPWSSIPAMPGMKGKIYHPLWIQGSNC